LPHQALRHDVIWFLFGKRKVLPDLKIYWVALISVFSALNQTPVFSTLRSRMQGQCIARCACLRPSFCWSHCAYPRRDGQAELTWVAGYILGWSAMDCCNLFISCLSCTMNQVPLHYHCSHFHAAYWSLNTDGVLKQMCKGKGKGKGQNYSS